jgi:two-component system, chemotaxis family, response regulator Rcp1
VASGFLGRRFKEANIHVNFHIATHGIDAMDFLEREANGAGKRLPDLILLDLNLPKKGNADPQLKTIPVVTVTTSASQADITRSYLLHANSYINNSTILGGFLDVIKSSQEVLFTALCSAHRTPIIQLVR